MQRWHVLFLQIRSGIIERPIAAGHRHIAANVDIRRVVFTDLDGTLLDHDTYDWQPAASTLEELETLGVPVVLVSSKTLAELERLRRALGVNGPVIAENGAAIDSPAGYFPQAVSGELSSVDRLTLHKHFSDIRDDGGFDCVSFFELGEDGIAASTGLSKAEARLANQRESSEPIQWNDSEARLKDFAAAAEARGLRCTRGGRFVHLMGAVDKGDAVKKLSAAYRAKWPGANIETIALGDGPNDLGMLRSADTAVVIPGHHASPMPLDGHGHVIRASQPGPRGWAASMRQIIDSWQ